MDKSIKEAICENNIDSELFKQLKEKIIDLIMTIQVRHGLIILGGIYSLKTTTYRIL